MLYERLHSMLQVYIAIIQRIIMLNAIMHSVIWLNVIMQCQNIIVIMESVIIPGFNMLNVIIRSVIVQNAIIISVIMLSVIMQFQWILYHCDEFFNAMYHWAWWHYA